MNDREKFPGCNYRAEYVGNDVHYFWAMTDDNAVRNAEDLALACDLQLTGLYHLTDHGEYDITPGKEDL